MAGFLPFSAIYIELCACWRAGAAVLGGMCGCCLCSQGAAARCALCWLSAAAGCSAALLPASWARPPHPPTHPPHPCMPPAADYIFASVWGHKVYTIYSILFIVFLILIIVTAFITIALTYFQLAVEDHRWAGGWGGWVAWQA